MIKRLLFACTTMLFFSCSSDDSNDTDLGIYPDKIYYLYDEFGIGRMDTMEINTVFYDAQKRVTKIENVFEGDLFERWKYYYNGTEERPFKTEMITYEMHPYSDSNVVYHFYDGNDRKIKDSTIQYDLVGGYETKVTTYSYAPGFMYGYTTGDITDTAVLDARGNIISNKKYGYHGIPGQLSFESTYTYDNKPFPFARMSNYLAHLGFPVGETLYYEKFSPNNVLTQYETYESQPMTDYIYNYVYRSDGLPLVAEQDWEGELARIIYTYKNL